MHTTNCARIAARQFGVDLAFVYFLHQPETRLKSLQICNPEQVCGTTPITKFVVALVTLAVLSLLVYKVSRSYKDFISGGSREASLSMLPAH